MNTSKNIEVQRVGSRKKSDETRLSNVKIVDFSKPKTNPLNNIPKFENKNLSIDLSSRTDGFNKDRVSQAVSEIANPVIGKFTGVFAICGSVSINRRGYSKQFWEEVIETPMVQYRLDMGQMVGTLEHPPILEDFTEEGNFTVRHPRYGAFIVKDLKIVGNKVIGTAYILNTPMGRLLATYMTARDESGELLTQIFMSVRGYSEHDYFDKNGIDQMKSTDYLLDTFDAVFNPGVAGTKVKVESGNSSRVGTPIHNQIKSKLESSTLDGIRDFTKKHKILNHKKDLIRSLNLKQVSR